MKWMNLTLVSSRFDMLSLIFLHKLCTWVSFSGSGWMNKLSLLKWVSIGEPASVVSTSLMRLPNGVFETAMVTAFCVVGRRRPLLVFDLSFDGFRVKILIVTWCWIKFW